MHFWAKYNTQTAFRFPVIVAGAQDFAASGDWTPATGDTKISKDGGDVANTSNNPAAVGGSGSVLWTLTLTATELQAAEVVVQIVDSATKAVEDQCLVIYTYGHASAKVQADLSDSVRLGLTALPNAAADGAGGLPISDAGGLDLDVKLADTNEVTAARMGALTDLIDGGRLDLLIDAIKAKTDLGLLNTTWTDAKAAYLDQAISAAKTLTAAYDAAKTAAQAGDAMALTAGERTTLAAALEAAIINELDGQAVMQAIADLIAGDMTTGDLSVLAIASAVWSNASRTLSANTNLNDPTAAAIASQVRTELTVELGRIDAAISTRHPSGAAVAKSPATLASGDVTGNLPADVKAWNGAALPTIGTSTLDAAGVRAAIGMAAANLDTQLGDVPTVSEFQARTLLASAYATLANQATLLARIVGTLAAGTHTAQSGDSYGRLGAPAGASVSADIAAVKAVVDGINPGAGGGSTEEVVTVTDGTDPIEGVQVWVTTDEAGANVIASGTTDTNGQVTFYLDPGTYYCWKQLSDWTFTNPQTLTVS